MINDEFKVIFVDKPYQGKETTNLTIINGEVYFWTVQEVAAPINATFQTWLQDKKAQLIESGKMNLVEGLFIYDISPVIISEKETALTIRYDLIKKKQIDGNSTQI